MRLDNETVFIVGEHSFSVRENCGEVPSSMVVTVTMDGHIEWSFQEPGWRSMAFGASVDIPYLWSARELIVLPRNEADAPEVLAFDEDLLHVFRAADGWLMVCETSVRRVINGTESDRVDLDDVVEQVRWGPSGLHLLDASGQEHWLRIDGARLILRSA